MSGLKRLFRSAVGFLYPPGCLACGAPLDGELEDDAVSACPSCCEQLQATDAPVCEKCSAPVGPYLNTVNGCVLCARDKFRFERIFALGVYDGALRKSVQLSKLAQHSGHAALAASLLFDRWGAALQEWRPDVIVPVPRHWTSRLVQGHAAQEVIAATLSRHLHVPVDMHLLRKKRRTKPQSKLEPSQRRGNLKGAFAVKWGVRLNGCRVLLVDDVLTTGTTADRASRALLDGGAGSVLVAVVARGVGK